MKMLKWIVAGLLGLLLLLQIVPVSHSNPAVTGEIDAPDAVIQVLRGSCYDCHSNETDWRWYNYVAPVSFWTVHHVEEGREHLNFSEWESYDPDERAHLAEEIVEEVEENHMPLRSYVWVHEGTDVTSEELAILRDWVQQHFESDGHEDHSH